MKHLDLTATP